MHRGSASISVHLTVFAARVFSITHASFTVSHLKKFIQSVLLVAFVVFPFALRSDAFPFRVHVEFQ